MPYLTPSSLPPTTRGRLLFIPDSVEWLALVHGALLELADLKNWEQSPGGITPVAAAEAAFQMLLSATDMPYQLIAAFERPQQTFYASGAFHTLPFTAGVYNPYNIEPDPDDPIMPYIMPTSAGPGWYRINAYQTFLPTPPSTPVGALYVLNLNVNGQVVAAMDRQHGLLPNTIYQVKGSRVFYAEPGDEIYLTFYHNTGGTVSTPVQAEARQHGAMTIERLALA